MFVYNWNMMLFHLVYEFSSPVAILTKNTACLHPFSNFSHLPLYSVQILSSSCPSPSFSFHSAFFSLSSSHRTRDDCQNNTLLPFISPWRQPIPPQILPLILPCAQATIKPAEISFPHTASPLSQSHRAILISARCRAAYLAASDSNAVSHPVVHVLLRRRDRGTTRLAKIVFPELHRHYRDTASLINPGRARASASVQGHTCVCARANKPHLLQCSGYVCDIHAPGLLHNNAII